MQGLSILQAVLNLPKVEMLRSFYHAISVICEHVEWRGGDEAEVGPRIFLRGQKEQIITKRGKELKLVMSGHWETAGQRLGLSVGQLDLR